MQVAVPSVESEELPILVAEEYEIIMDRREAIRSGLAQAQQGYVVLISGKGTDPYIMEALGKKTPWDDASVVREELARLSKN